MPKIILTGEEARMVVYDENNKWERITENEIDDHSRWTVGYNAVFKKLDTGKYYIFYWNVGATEQQDKSPYEYDKEVSVTQVEKNKKEIYVWEAIK